MPPWLPPRIHSLILLLCLGVIARVSAQEPTIVRVRDARKLSNTAAEKLRPSATIEGTMVYGDSSRNDWFFHDGDAGIYILGEGITLKSKTGDKVRLDGFIAAGGFAPVFRVTNEIILGAGSLPIPSRPSMDQILSGSEDSQWVEVSGILLESVRHEGNTILTFESAFGDLILSVYGAEDRITSKLNLGANLKIQGVAASNYNGQGRFLGARIHVPSEKLITVLSNGPTNLFELPLIPLDEVLTFTPGQKRRTLVHTRGYVTHRDKDGTIFVQSGKVGMRTHPSSDCPFQPGDSVELAGFTVLERGVQDPRFPDLVMGTPSIRSAKYRPTAPVSKPEIIQSESLEWLRDADATLFQATGQIEGTWAGYNSVIAMLISTGPDKRTFEIVLDAPSKLNGAERLMSLRKGAIIRALGVLDTSKSANIDTDGARLHLNTFDDITVISPGTWLTEKHVALVGSALIAVIAAAATWNVQLRRKVRLQTEAIQHRLEQERAMERRYHDLAENAVDLILTLRLDGTVLTANAAVTPMLGYPRDKVIGWNIIDRIGPKHRDWITGRLKEIEAHGKVELGVKPIDVISASGKIVTIEASSHLVQSGGQPAVLEIVARDVTERNRAQEQRDGQAHILGLIASGTALEDVLEELMRFIESASPGVLGSILRLDEDGITLRKAAAPSLPEAYNNAIDGLRAGEGVGCCGTAVARGVPVLVKDISTDPLWAGRFAQLAAEHGLASCWSFPIHSTSGRVLGTFALYRREICLPSQEELAVIDTGRSLASVALERAESEMAVRTSEERLRACIAEAPHVGVQWYDESGRVVFWNRASEEMFGWTSEEAMGRTLDQLIFSREQGAAFLEILADLRRNSGQFGPQEFTFRTREGKNGVCLSTVFRIPSKSGSMLFVCMDVDVTARVSAERALISSEQRQRMVIASLAEGVVLVERDGHISAFNEQVGKLLGETGTAYFQRPEGPMPWTVLNEDGTEMQPEQYPPAVTFQTGAPQQDVVVGIRHSDSSVQWLSVNSRPAVLGASGQMESVVVSFADITTRKQVQAELIRAKEEAESANRAKTDFLAIMSHEIRTPLNGVIGFTDLLLNSHLAEEHRQFAETIKQSGEILLALINDILDLSKIEAGRLELQQIPYGFIDVVVDVVGIMSVRAEEKGIELALCVAGDLPPQMVGDGARVRQILMNLVGNAVKFTDRGHVLVEVDRDAEGLVVSVTDTGPGIPTDKRDQLFQRFSQIASPSTRQHGGTGLGLAISKELVRMMSGEIGLADAQGGGSRFWVRLPCPPSSESKSFRPPASLLGVRVLIANTAPVNQRVLRRQLSAWGCATDLVDPENVLEMLSSGARSGRPWDVVLLDLSSPANSAMVRLARDIRSGDWPAVGLVAIHRRSTPAAFFVEACEATLSKPLASPEPLQAALNQALKRSRLRDTAS